MDFSSGDIITIIIFIVGLLASYVKFREGLIAFSKDTDKEIALIKQEITIVRDNHSEKDMKFEKVLEKLEEAIEKLNVSQLELSKAIIMLQAEIKNKMN